MLLDAALLTVIVALLAGGRLSRLKHLDLRAPWAFVAAAAVQAAVMLLGARGSAVAAQLGGPAHVVSFAVLLAALWMNRHLKGALVVGLGVVMNFLVIAANGGSMPVDRDLAVRSGSQSMVALLDSESWATHMPVTATTRLRWLGDVLPLPMVPRPKPYCPGSLGDIFVTAGACWLILSGMGAFRLGMERDSGSGPDAEGDG